MSGGLRALLSAAQACASAGPLQTLLRSRELAECVADSCAAIAYGVQVLSQAGLAANVAAHAAGLAPQLAGVSVSYVTLARLHNSLCELQEEVSN